MSEPSPYQPARGGKVPRYPREVGATGHAPGSLNGHRSERNPGIVIRDEEPLDNPRLSASGLGAAAPADNDDFSDYNDGNYYGNAGGRG